MTAPLQGGRVHGRADRDVSAPGTLQHQGHFSTRDISAPGTFRSAPGTFRSRMVPEGWGNAVVQMLNEHPMQQQPVAPVPD